MTTKKEKSVEEIYQKKSQLEHILLRPDTCNELNRHWIDPITAINTVGD